MEAGLQEFEPKLEHRDTQIIEKLKEAFEHELGEQKQAIEQKLEKQKQEFEQKLEDRDEQMKELQEKQKEAFEHELGEQKQKLDEQKQEFERKLNEKDEQITANKQQLSSDNIRMEIGIPPYYITVPDYQETYIHSPPMYTYPGGYKFRLELYPNGWDRGEGTHVSVYVYARKGDYDSNLKIPAKFTLTVELLNQHRDQHHWAKEIECEVTGHMAEVGRNTKFLPHADLEWNQNKQTQYLKNNCLKFRITKIVMK